MDWEKHFSEQKKQAEVAKEKDRAEQEKRKHMRAIEAKEANRLIVEVIKPIFTAAAKAAKKSGLHAEVKHGGRATDAPNLQREIQLKLANRQAASFERSSAEITFKFTTGTEFALRTRTINSDNGNDEGTSVVPIAAITEDFLTEQVRLASMDLFR